REVAWIGVTPSHTWSCACSSSSSGPGIRRSRSGPTCRCDTLSDCVSFAIGSSPHAARPEGVPRSSGKAALAAAGQLTRQQLPTVGGAEILGARREVDGYGAFVGRQLVDGALHRRRE